MNKDSSFVKYKELKIPEKLINNFDDYDKLEISEYEKKILFELREYSDINGVEAIKVTYEGGETEICSNDFYGRVQIPNEVKGKRHITIFNSHTDVSVMSMADMIKLTDINVDRIALVNKAYCIYVVIAKGSYRPSIEEFKTLYDYIRREVVKELASMEYGIITVPEINYMLIQEIMYRVCRHYKWKIQGGKFNE